MATLSSAGIGSGLDVRAIVAQLMAIERQPLAALQTATKKTQDQLSVYGKLESAMTALRDAARKLTSTDTWRATTVASAKPEAVVATTNGSTPAGTYSVNVSRLASSQTLVSQSTYGTASDAVGPGSITIELGTWSAGQTGFTPKPDAAAVTLRFNAPDDTLEDVRDRINTSGAGVTASIVSDANGLRLAIRSTATGEANGFRISVNDDDGDNGDPAGLSVLAFDPSVSVSQMTQGSAAVNALATINGVPVSSATNSLDAVLDGLSFQFAQVTTAPVDVTVNRDDAGMKAHIVDFANKYNDLVKLMRENTRSVDGDTPGGVLQGDNSALGLLRQLRSLAGSTSGAVTEFTRLADIGLEPQRDGTLKIDEKKIGNAMANLPALQDFFARDDMADDSLDGFGALFRAFGDQRLAAEGPLASRKEALQGRIERNNERSEALEQRLALREKRLTEQYGRLDTMMARMNSLQNYVTQQVANWNKPQS